MSRLDMALNRLAERGHPIGSDLLLERLERQLSGEPTPGVVALDTRRRPMQTTPTTTERRIPWWRGRPVAVVAAAAVVLAVVAIVGLTDSDRTSVAATSTTTAAVVDTGGLVVTFDGETCDYSGPDRVSLSNEISLTFVNESDDEFFAGIKRIPSDSIDELAPLVGTDFDWSNETFLDPTLFVQTGPHDQDEISAFVAGAGTYVVDCTLLDGAAPLHSWWPATFEVTP